MSIRLHASLVVVLVVAGGACLRPDLGGTLAPLALAVYLVSLLAHEAAHAIAAKQTPASRRDAAVVVLGPLGDLTRRPAVGDPGHRVFVAMAGPVANLALVVAAACALVVGDSVTGVETLRRALLDPLDVLLGAVALGATPGASLASVVVAVNWPLFALSLLPAQPFDGSAALRGLLDPWVGTRRSDRSTTIAAAVSAAALLAWSWRSGVVGDGSEALATASAALAVFLLFGAWGDASQAAAERPDLFSHSLQDDEPTDVFDAWDDAPQRIGTAGAASGLDEALEDPEADDRRVDEVLEKLHLHGLDRLTADERAVLQRASDRYRRRLTAE